MRFGQTDHKWTILNHVWMGCQTFWACLLSTISLVMWTPMWVNAFEQPQKTASSLSTDLILKHYRMCCWSMLARQDLNQGSPDMVLEGRCPAEFSSNPNQTHLKQLINLLLGILQTSSQVCWDKLELNSAGHRPSRIKFGDPWFKLCHLKS